MSREHLTVGERLASDGREELVALVEVEVPVLYDSFDCGKN